MKLNEVYKITFKENDKLKYSIYGKPITNMFENDIEAIIFIFRKTYPNSEIIKIEKEVQFSK